MARSDHLAQSDKCSLGRVAIRRGKGVPALAMVPMSPVPFFPIVETPGASGEECPDR